jgi:hypothetical protein
MTHTKRYIAPRKHKENGVGFACEHDREANDIEQRWYLHQISQMVLRFHNNVGRLGAAEELEILIAQLAFQDRGYSYLYVS